MNKLIEKFLPDQSIRDVLSVTLFAVVEALQLMIVMATIYSFIPIPLADFIKELPLKLQKGIQPEREIFFYRSFLIFAVGLQAGVMIWCKRQRIAIPRRFLGRMAVVDTAFIFIQLFAVFKIWKYDNPWWARDLLYGGMGAWLLSKIFWVEGEHGFKKISEVMMEKRNILKICVDAAVPLLLLICLIPDINKALGRIFVWDQFRNWDTAITMPGWGYIHGMGLNTAIISPWGMGAVIFISRLSQLWGGFDTSHLLIVAVGMVIVYYIALYAFVRAWLGSVLLAASVVAVAVKLQMFHTGISPLIWIYPQDTALRHWLDLPVLWCLWHHAGKMQKKYLWWAAIGIGVALAWALSTGLCLLGAFWGYLIFLCMAPLLRPAMFRSFKDLRAIVLTALLPLGIMLVMFLLLQGTAVFHASFWKNLIEPIALFLGGTGTLSFYACLYDRHFFAFVAGFVIPLIYLWTLLITASSVSEQKAKREDLFVMVLCLYGLLMYVHYLAHASISHYYAVGVPVVMIAGWWLRRLPLKMLILIAAVSWSALFTNIFFIYYPNVFDLARMNWQQEMDFHQSQSQFEEDANLVDRLITKNKGAAVISSFETGILMQADRRPFFYDAPLVNSSRMDQPAFAGTSITPDRVARCIHQLQEQAPEYIFVQKSLLGQWPPEYVQYYPGIIVVLRYITEHYEAAGQGQYLVALHQKHE